jgi:uncharacterized iron-regulated membrane protein
MGILFGVLNRAVSALTAIGVIAGTVWGYRMWWQRRPTRGGAWATDRPPLRGALRHLSTSAALLVIVVRSFAGGPARRRRRRVGTCALGLVGSSRLGFIPNIGCALGIGGSAHVGRPPVWDPGLGVVRG